MNISRVRKAQIFLIGYYGMENLGDDAIRESIERAGEKLGVDIGHYAVRAKRDDDPRAVRLRGSGWRAYLGAIWNADRIAIGGGGLLKDEGSKYWQGYGFLFEILATVVLARMLGKSVVLVGIGVGPIYSRLGEYLISLIARLSNVRVARDQASANVLKHLGVRNVDVCADPVFSMRKETLTTDSCRSWPPRHMLISVRPWYQMAPDGVERWRQLVVAVAKMADEAIEDGLVIAFTCLYWPQDRVAAEEIAAEMYHAECVKIPTNANHWPGLTEDMRRTDVLISMRYHAIVCAAMARTPTFALSYEPKVDSLAAGLKIPIININDRTKVDALAAEVRSYRKADAPVPSSFIIEEATERMFTSAWQGLTKALRQQSNQ